MRLILQDATHRLFNSLYVPTHKADLPLPVSSFQICPRLFRLLRLMSSHDRKPLIQLPAWVVLLFDIPQSGQTVTVDRL